MSWRSFFGGILTTLLAVAAGVVIAGAVFDLRIESQESEASADEALSQAEEDELQRQDFAILRYCTEDRSFSAQLRYKEAIDNLIATARRKPQASYLNAGLFSGFVPTMQQYLIDQAAVIRRKCSELGDERAWADDVQQLQDVGQQLASENGG